MDIPEPVRPRLLWITDPWSTLDHPRDTTLRLIEESLILGAASFWTDVTSVRWEEGETRLDAHRVRSVRPDRSADSFSMGDVRCARPSEFDVVLYRPDPPVDLAYLHPLQLLLLDVERDGPRRRPSNIVNPPHLLFTQSEKLAGSFLPGRAPPTLVSSRWESLRRFGEEQGLAVVKPMHLCQSKDVELLDFRGDAARAERIVRSRTADFRRPCVLQRFLPGVVDGETRIWFLDGAVLGVVRKRAADGGYRIDMDKGGVLLPHRLTETEKAVLPEIGGWLRAHDVRFAAVDLIDGWITDFNFTSPGLITGMESVVGENLARPIVEALLSTRAGDVERSRRATGGPGGRGRWGERPYAFSADQKP